VEVIMEITDTKIAIGAIVIIVAILTVAAYLAGVISETLALGLATGAIGAVAGLAGVEIGKKIE
jgi:hypothetical protein